MRGDPEGVPDVPILKCAELVIKEIPWIASHAIAKVSNPAAAAYCRNIRRGDSEPYKHILVLPRHKLIYVAVPKAASTRIRRTLACIEGRYSRSLKPSRRLKHRGPYGPRNMTVGSFHRLATDAATFKLSFVRNPYARIVSCWADKFAHKPLVAGDSFIDAYLAVRREIDAALPHGANATLSFADFVAFVVCAGEAYKDGHLRPQANILAIPGLDLDFIGRVELFDTDFARVLDHLHACERIRGEALASINKSSHGDWPAYYTPELAGRIYRAYETDFDRFAYAKALAS